MWDPYKCAYLINVRSLYSETFIIDGTLIRPPGPPPHLQEVTHSLVYTWCPHTPTAVVVLDVLQLCPVCMYKCSNKYPYSLGGSDTSYIELIGAISIVKILMILHHMSWLHSTSRSHRVRDSWESEWKGYYSKSKPGETLGWAWPSGAAPNPKDSWVGVA